MALLISVRDYRQVSLSANSDRFEEVTVYTASGPAVAGAYQTYARDHKTPFVLLVARLRESRPL